MEFNSPKESYPPPTGSADGRLFEEKRLTSDRCSGGTSLVSTIIIMIFVMAIHRQKA